MLKNTLFCSPKITSALEGIDKPDRALIELFLEKIPGRGWNFIPPEDPAKAIYTYRKDLRYCSAVVIQHGEGGDGNTTYSMVLTSDVGGRRVVDASEVIANEAFSILEAKKRDTIAYQERHVADRAFSNLVGNFDLPVISNPDVNSELKCLSDIEANWIITILPLADSIEWKSIPPTNQNNKFSYELTVNQAKVAVDLTGDLHDYGAMHSYELRIVSKGNLVHCSNGAIARELFDTVEAHSGQLSNWIEEQAYSEI